MTKLPFCMTGSNEALSQVDRTNANLIIGLALILFVGCFPTVAAAVESDLSGVWYKNGNPKKPLKLILKQNGMHVIGKFTNGKKGWRVVGTLLANGTLSLRRQVPIAELENSSKLQKEAFRKKYPFPDRKNLLLAPAKFEFNRGRWSLVGHYTRLAREKDGTFNLVPEKLNFAKAGKLRPHYLADKRSRFHRLFIVGPGGSKWSLIGAIEHDSFKQQALGFKNLLKSESPSVAGGSSKLINPTAESMSVNDVLQQITQLAKKVKFDDQVLIYFTGHGSGGKHASYEFNVQYKGEMEKYTKELDKYLKKSMEKNDLLLLMYYEQIVNFPFNLISDEKKTKLKNSYEIAKLNQKKFKKKFDKEYFKVNQPFIKLKSAEKYNEWIWLTDLNKNYMVNADEWLDDVRFAHAMKPLITTGASVTIVFDSCFGGGFADNLAGAANVKVIGLNTFCSNPVSAKNTITGVLHRLISTGMHWNDMSPLTVSYAMFHLEQAFPGLVGNPKD